MIILHLIFRNIIIIIITIIIHLFFRNFIILFIIFPNFIILHFIFHIVILILILLNIIILHIIILHLILLHLIIVNRIILNIIVRNIVLLLLLLVLLLLITIIISSTLSYIIPPLPHTVWGLLLGKKMYVMLRPGEGCWSGKCVLTAQGHCLGCRVAQMADEICFQYTKPWTINPKSKTLKPETRSKPWKYNLIKTVMKTLKPSMKP